MPRAALLATLLAALALPLRAQAPDSLPAGGAGGGSDLFPFGSSTVSFTWAELRPYIRPDGPLAPFAGGETRPLAARALQDSGRAA